MKNKFVYASGIPSAPKKSARAFAAAEKAFGRPADLAKRDGELSVDHPQVDPNARRHDLGKA